MKRMNVCTISFFSRHPAFGMGFGPGYKFSFGYDYVGDYYDGSNQPNPDTDPFDCQGHGTHVAGIIGAQSVYFTGVAPNATLGMYRVFGCEGSTATDILFAAYLDAQKAKCNVHQTEFYQSMYLFFFI